MITLIARVDHGDQRLTATLTCSEDSYGRFPGVHENMVRSWFTEDYPGVDQKLITVEVHRG